MKLSDLAQAEAWMDLAEQQDWQRFRNGVRRMFQKRGVQDTPLLALRVADVGITWILVRRLERSLFPTPDADPGVPLGISPSLLDHIGKSRERLRKAIRELEDACARLGTPVHTGLADTMLPLVRPTADLLLEPGLIDGDENREEDN